ncbi:MAG: carbonic anhydrase [Rhodothermales bacterium]|nr:carbonic anhydrase [Rhodothermales bacterium]
MKSQDALKRLLNGNERFVENKQQIVVKSSSQRREELSDSQSPFAVILTCSDSRLPAEILFDQGLGDLFVVRVAGNVINPEVVGSVEFAVQSLGSNLVLVMGHTKCGAVTAALECTRDPSIRLSPGLSSIVDRIRPSIERVISSGGSRSDDDILDDGIAENTRVGVELLLQSSEILREKVNAGNLSILGASYSIESGKVSLLDN